MPIGTSPLELTTGKLPLAGLKADPVACALCADGVAARMARQFALLERLGAVTIVLAEALGAEAAKYPGSSGAAAFVQVARALRQTVALGMRLDAERERLKAAARRTVMPVAARDDAADDAAEAAPNKGGLQDQAAQAGAAPDDAAPDDAAPDDAATVAPREDLLRDVRERCDTGDELRGHPSGEVVGRICERLGIEADLSCFTDEEMGRLAALRYPPLAKPPAALSDAQFEAALARPSQMPMGQMAMRQMPMGQLAVSPNQRLRAIEAAAADMVCAGGVGGHDPPG